MLLESNLFISKIIIQTNKYCYLSFMIHKLFNIYNENLLKLNFYNCEKCIFISAKSISNHIISISIPLKN